MTTTDHALLAAVLHAAGVRYESAEAVSADLRGRGGIRGYRVEVIDPAGGRETHHLYLDDSGQRTEGEGIQVLGDSGVATTVWQYPADPGLPALPAAVNPAGARALLARIGIPLAADPRVAVLSYRPTRRAAVRLTWEEADGPHGLFLKVVPPDGATDLADRHTRWADAGLPVPRIHASAREGLLVMETLPGVGLDTIPDALGTAASGAAALDALRERVASVPESGAARRSPAERVGWYLDRLPLSSALRHEIADGVAVRRRRGGDAATIHGDLHLAQVLVDPHERRITGLLDLDTAGVGDPADDDGALWAHVAVSAELAGESTRALRELADALAPSRLPAVHRDRAAAVAATQLLGHAVSGRLPASRAADLARALLRAPDENPLMTLSPASHDGPGS